MQSPTENKVYCPVISLKKWIIHAKINNAVLIYLTKQVALTIQKYALLAGLDKNKYAGHSLRSDLQHQQLKSVQMKEVLWQYRS